MVRAFETAAGVSPHSRPVVPDVLGTGDRWVVAGLDRATHRAP